MDREERQRAKALRQLKAACPRCGRMCAAEGELCHQDLAMPVFMCDRCTDSVAFLDSFIDVAVAFTVHAETWQSIEITHLLPCPPPPRGAWG